ncbi:cardiolipin synthase ClsB [Eleftheria terrae]|uniref:cardiolipin synthase ClsB n=1 Tax=Eleftheria terrae TaxID=1597781 RepID=UPI00263B5C6E|nr:cardiolipin synthase ClsB [Eleftheria terrae]WKB52172.1 cardiolipin synthase ClsB [Eleftheria terrae]
MAPPPQRSPARGVLPPGPLSWYEHTRAHFLGGNQVRLLRGGRELFPAMCEAIGRARHEVWFATYIFHDDPTAAGVADCLCQAARRGVRVRAIIDGFGSHATLPRLLPQLREAGVQVMVFRPIKGWWSWLRPGQLRRLHQKLCVVDGHTGYVGGINVIDDLFDLRHGWSEAPRLDYAVEVSGPTVVPIEQTARAMWTRARLGRDWREELAELARSPHRVARARRLVRRLQSTRWARHAHAVADPAPMRAAFVVRDNLSQRRTIERAYIEAIRHARERIDLVSPYFYPGRAFRRALRLAAQRGVRVRLLLQGKLDYRIAGLAARVLYDELLAHGVQIYEYMPAFLHAKVALVDDSWATVGSSNIDPLSLLLNLEANVIVRDPAFVDELAGELDAAFAASHQVTRPELGVPNWWSRVRRAFVAWGAHVYLKVAGATGRY